MSPNKRRRFNVPVIVLLLSITFMAVPTAPTAQAANNYSIDGDVITITVNVEFIGNQARKVIKDWTKAFNRHWGEENRRDGPFTDGCRKVVFKPNFVLQGKGGPEYHVITVYPVDPGHDFRSRVKGQHEYRPTEQNRHGQWGSNSDHKTIAHEFGHLFGLGDEYTDVDADGNEVPRGTGKRSIPNPNIPNSDVSIMGTGDTVLLRHIKDIVKKHLPPDKLKCKWQGTLEQTTIGTTATANVNGTTVVTYQMALILDEDEHGVLTGRADATFTFQADFSLECGSTTTFMEPVSGELSVIGQRDDEIMHLEISADGPIEGLLETTGAGGCGSNTMAHDFSADLASQSGAGWPSPLSRDGSVYRLDETQTPVPGVEDTLTIVVEPVNDEGIPVG